MRRDLLRLLQPLIVLHFVIMLGIAGYMLIEHFNFMEALYMTTITVTTAGFAEVRPLSSVGRMFTTFLLIFSWMAMAFVLTRLTQYIISGEVNKFFKNRKIMSAIDKIRGHVVICGYGRNGQQAAHTLKVHGQQFVVIESDENLTERVYAESPDVLFINGDGTDDEILKRARVEWAKALITTLP